MYAWETPNPPLNYLVFETLDAEGTQRGGLLTPNPLPQNQTFTYNLRENPILVVIIDNIGEATTATVKTKIVEEKVAMTDEAAAPADGEAAPAADPAAAPAADPAAAPAEGGRRLRMTDADMDGLVEEILES